MITSWNAPEIIDRARKAALRGSMAAIGKVDEKAVELITTGSKSGRIYRRRGVEHQASAPGEAPASDTGRLVASREIKMDAQALRTLLIFHTLYAWFLEVGTIHMEPRPFARRALLEAGPAARAAFAGEMVAEFRK